MRQFWRPSLQPVAVSKSFSCKTISQKERVDWQDRIDSYEEHQEGHPILLEEEARTAQVAIAATLDPQAIPPDTLPLAIPRIVLAATAAKRVPRAQLAPTPLQVRKTSLARARIRRRLRPRPSMCTARVQPPTFCCCT